jgi:hypothetical protein
MQGSVSVNYKNKQMLTCTNSVLLAMNFTVQRQKDHKQFLFNVARGVVAVAAQGIKVVLATATAD